MYSPVQTKSYEQLKNNWSNCCIYEKKGGSLSCKDKELNKIKKYEIRNRNHKTI